LDIIIVGIGVVGREIIKQLELEGHNIVAIDSDGVIINDIINNHDVQGIEGNGMNKDVLLSANVATADVLIAATPHDEMNVLCCIIGKHLGAKKTIARIKQKDYIDIFQKADLDIDFFVNPEYEAAHEIARGLRYPSAIKIEIFGDGKIDLVELRIEAGDKLENVRLKDLSTVTKGTILICAVMRNDVTYIPNGDFTLQVGDIVFITGSRWDTYLFFRSRGKSKKTKDVMLIGGSRTAAYLAQELEASGIHAKLIEQSAERCKFLFNMLKDTELINGDGTDRKLLIDEGIESCDSVITLTNSDETNIITSMYAKSKGVPRVITKLDKELYMDMMDSTGLETVISSRMSAANQIVRYVRSISGDGDETKFRRMYQIEDGEIEGLEFEVTESFKHLSTPIKNLQLVDDLIIAAIIREGKVIIPDGNTTLEKKDLVIVVTANDIIIDDLNDILIV